MEMGKQPVVFENPMYTTRDSSGKVVLPAQVRQMSHSPFFELLLLLDLTLLGNVPQVISCPSSK